MVEVKIDNMEFKWDAKNSQEFAQIKECLEILKTMGLEVERIKAANQRISVVQKYEIERMRKRNR